MVLLTGAMAAPMAVKAAWTLGVNLRHKVLTDICVNDNKRGALDEYQGKSLYCGDI